MQIPIAEELLEIFRRIAAEAKTEDEWAEIESDDMFQSTAFDGGFDATERAFCFSYYDRDGEEYWFQLTLDEVIEIVEGRRTSLKGRPAF